MTPEAVIAQFPSFAAFLKIPEIADMLANLSPDATSAEFTAKLHETKWWKGNSESSRTAQALKIGDPAEYRNRVAQTLTQVLNIMAAEGIPGTMATAVSWAEGFLAQGANADQMRQALVSKASLTDNARGKVDATAAQILKSADDYGVKVSNQWAFDAAKKAEMTGSGLEDAQGNLKDWAKALFPHLAKQLDEGYTVRQIAEPYLQTASQLLEKDANSFSMTDPKFTAALAQRQKDGSTQPMSMEDWQTKIMSDSRYGWDATQNAKQTAFTIRDQLAQQFGVR